MGRLTWGIPDGILLPHVSLPKWTNMGDWDLVGARKLWFPDPTTPCSPTWYASSVLGFLAGFLSSTTGIRPVELFLVSEI